MKRIFWLILGMCFLWSCGQDKSEPLKLKKLRGDVYQVEKKEVLVGRIYPGQVEAKDKVLIKALISGKITRFLREEGEKIEKNSLLVEIDTTFLLKELYSILAEIKNLREEYNLILLKLEQAKRDYNRYVNLFQKGVISKQELEKSELAKNILKKNLDSLQAKIDSLLSKKQSLEHKLSYSRIKSPVYGYLIKKYVNKGDIVNVGDRLAELYASDALRFSFFVEDKFFNKIKQESKFLVYFPSLQKELFLRVIEKVPYTNKGTQSFAVKLKLEGNLLPGSYGEVFFPLKKIKSLLVPLQAVANRGGLDYVYVVEEKGILRYRLVSLGDTYLQKESFFWPSYRGDWVEVLTGLKSGERVFLEPFRGEEGAFLDAS